MTKKEDKLRIPVYFAFGRSDDVNFDQNAEDGRKKLEHSIKELLLNLEEHSSTPGKESLALLGEYKSVNDTVEAALILGDPSYLDMPSLKDTSARRPSHPVPCIFTLLEDTWDEKLKDNLNSPFLDVLGVFRLKRLIAESRDPEDYGAFAAVIKDVVRAWIKREKKTSESTDAKPIAWKARLSENDSEKSRGFVSLFADPATRQMSRVFKEALLHLDRNELRSIWDEVTEKIGNNTPTPGKPWLKARLDEIQNALGKNVHSFKIPSLLILGETGCGKSLLSQSVASVLRDGKIARVNIAAYTQDMIDTALFGAVQGSYTGLEQDNPGIFIENAGGVVFLDEIGDMDPVNQTRLLTYMDDGKVMPRGMNSGFLAPCIIVAATNRPINDPASGFRQDIVHRFDYKITIPPLRERKLDIRLLISLTLQNERVNPQTAKGRYVNFISIDAIEWLEEYNYPGNFRELEYILRQAVVMAYGQGCDCICLRHVIAAKA